MQREEPESDAYGCVGERGALVGSWTRSRIEDTSEEMLQTARAAADENMRESRADRRYRAGERGQHREEGIDIVAVRKDETHLIQRPSHS